jgi:phage shock protein PspC (stress-responsive transcriptional regulator)
MKKIININLSGRVIPIEDSAYESLQRYIESLRRYFANEEGRDEIINDIESRIAELMNDKIKKGNGAITDADVEEIINSMGRVEDFEKEDAQEATAGASATQSSSSQNESHTKQESKRFKGRLYRDSSDKMIGGVCAGIANYLNVDPAIVRLLFAIITFGGFGMGFFIYILLWIILPSRELESYIGKRLYRNPDDRIIGGVAGGLAAYFRRDNAWTIRLIFAAPLILNIFFSIINGIFSPWAYHFRPVDIAFGSITGTFIITYIILWIVLPEARSSFEKMEMRGEKVDVNRIRQNVQENMSDIKNKAQTWGEEVKTSAQQFGERAKEFASTRGKTFATEVRQTARPVASGIGHAIGVIFKAFFLFIAGTIAFALFVVVLVFILGGVVQPFKDFLLDGFWQNLSLWGVLILFLAVPLIAIITWIVRRAMRVRSQNRYLGWTFAGLWFLGFVCLGIFISSMVGSFRRYDRIEQNIPIQGGINKMIVSVNEPEIRYSGTFDWIENDGEGFDITEDSVHFSNVKLNVEKSNDSLYHVIFWRYSRGKNRNDAREKAEKIVYNISSLDSNLYLGSGLSIGKPQKFRGQQVLIEIRIPVGKRIVFDESVKDKLHPVKVRMREGRRWNDGNWNMDWDEWNAFYWDSNKEYIMAENGELEAVNFNPEAKSTAPGVYEYKKNTNDSIRTADSLRIQRIQIEERQKQLDEEKRRLEELQKSSTHIQVKKQQKHKSTASLQWSLSPFII